MVGSSLSFNETDLGQYGLAVRSRNIPLSFQVERIQLQDKSLSGGSKASPKAISLSIAVIAASAAALKTNLDDIKEVLNYRLDAKLELDTLTDRYWLARFMRLTGISHTNTFVGSLDFIADDPFAYDAEETTTPHDILSEPDTVEESVGGTARAEPVYTLTAGDTLTEKTIGITNLETGLGITWEGSLVSTDELEIDVANWLVKKNDVASMSTVSGQFPYLVPGIDNSIRVSNFGTHGSLVIKYRNRYA